MLKTWVCYQKFKASYYILQIYKIFCLAILAIPFLNSNLCLIYLLFKITL